jgi:hypothetical protein
MTLTPEQVEVVRGVYARYNDKRCVIPTCKLAGMAHYHESVSQLDKAEEYVKGLKKEWSKDKAEERRYRLSLNLDLK